MQQKWLVFPVSLSSCLHTRWLAFSLNASSRVELKMKTRKSNEGRQKSAEIDFCSKRAESHQCACAAKANCSSSIKSSSARSRDGAITVCWMEWPVVASAARAACARQKRRPLLPPLHRSPHSLMHPRPLRELRECAHAIHSVSSPRLAPPSTAAVGWLAREPLQQRHHPP